MDAVMDMTTLFVDDYAELLSTFFLFSHEA
jgi:hypothetical protein